jgi:hypothetical protein
LAHIILGERGFKCFYRKGIAPLQGEIIARGKIHRNFLKIFFSRTSRPKSIKLGTIYP